MLAVVFVIAAVFGVAFLGLVAWVTCTTKSINVAAAALALVGTILLLSPAAEELDLSVDAKGLNAKIGLIERQLEGVSEQATALATQNDALRQAVQEVRERNQEILRTLEERRDEAAEAEPWPSPDDSDTEITPQPYIPGEEQRRFEPQ